MTFLFLNIICFHHIHLYYSFLPFFPHYTLSLNSLLSSSQKFPSVFQVNQSGFLSLFQEMWVKNACPSQVQWTCLWSQLLGRLKEQDHVSLGISSLGWHSKTLRLFKNKGMLISSVYSAVLHIHRSSMLLFNHQRCSYNVFSISLLQNKPHNPASTLTSFEKSSA